MAATVVPGADLRSYPLLLLFFFNLRKHIRLEFFLSLFLIWSPAGTNKGGGGDFISVTEWLCVFYYPHDVWVSFVFECGLLFIHGVWVSELYSFNLSLLREHRSIPRAPCPALVIVVGRNSMPLQCKPSPDPLAGL